MPVPTSCNAPLSGPAGVATNVHCGIAVGAGQTALMPSQTGALSHGAGAAAHVVPAVASTSAGQATLVPLQVSAASQRSVAARQTLALERSVHVPSRSPPAATEH